MEDKALSNEPARIENLVNKYDLFYTGDNKYLMEAIGGSNHNRLYARITIDKSDLYKDDAVEILDGHKEHLHNGLQEELERRQSQSKAV